MAGRRRCVDEIPAGQCAVIGANIRTLRHRKGWTQAALGELMGWPTNSAVCAAEGRRDGRMAAYDALCELRGTASNRVLLSYVWSTLRRTARMLGEWMPTIKPPEHDKHTEWLKTPRLRTGSGRW